MNMKFSICLAAAFALSFHTTASAHGDDGKHTHPVLNTDPKAAPAATGTVLGHNGLKYRVDLNWAKADPKVAPVINSHGLAEDKKGLIYLVTDHPKNSFLVFKKDGTFVRSFGDLPGGHGIEIFEKDGKEYLIHVDCGYHFDETGKNENAKRNLGRITILDTNGKIIRKLPTPVEMGIASKFMPCDVAVTPKGTILIADGYGTDSVYEFTTTGELVRRWGGSAKDKPENLSNAHGISLDTSDPAQPKVWVPSRSQNQIKCFTLEGKLLETLTLPGNYAGQLFFRGDKIYTAVCWSKNAEGKKFDRSGFILIIDRKTKKVLSAPGGSEPVYKDDVLQPILQEGKTFIHGHDLYVDKAGAIYLGEWNADLRYPSKLTPVKE